MSDQLDPDLRRRVADARVARLATVRPDGGPHLVVITFALDDDTFFTAVDHKPKTTTDLQRLANLRAHPGASVLVDHYEEGWSRLWWVRGDGQAHILTEGPARERAVSLLADKYEPYRETRPSGPVIVIEIDRWTSWAA